MKFLTLPRVALAVAVAVVFGCSGGGSNGTSTAPNPGVRAINASSNSTAMDFVLNDTQIANNLGYLVASPGYVTVEPGDYDVMAAEEGNPESLVAEAKVLESDRSYLVVASGLVTPPNDDLEKRLRTTIITVDRNAPNGNKARIVIFHAYNRGPGLQTPNIDFQNPGDTPQFSVKDITFAGGSIRDIDSGVQSFVARRAGTEEDLMAPIQFDFRPGKIYAVIVAGQESDAAHPPAISVIEI